MSKESVGQDNVSPHLGEPLEQILDFETWKQGDELGATYARLEQEVREGLEQEERVNAEIRQRVLPRIKDHPNAPKGAGLYRATPDQIKWMHSRLLLNGATIAADGTVVAHDTLLMTMAQIGVCVVSYNGSLGEFRRDLFRRDMRVNNGNPVEEMIAVMEARQSRAALGYEDERDELNSLVRRGVMAFGERQALLKCGPDKWLMGHGTPAPRELLATSLQPMLKSSLDLLRELILNHQKFVFIPSEPRELLIKTLGDSLGPLQFLIVDTLYDQMNGWIEKNKLSREMGRLAREFVEEIGPQVVRGVYRASASSPACVFYAHVDHAQEAALIALSDSVLQEHRGFPMLLDIADNLCRVNFEPASFRAIVQQSYAKAGQPFRYLTERETRR